jgi:hypothetical protein
MFVEQDRWEVADAGFKRVGFGFSLRPTQGGRSNRIGVGINKPSETRCAP